MVLPLRLLVRPTEQELLLLTSPVAVLPGLHIFWMKGNSPTRN